ncbi:ATP phosphoribosyltransferase regulatory subunit [Parasphingopyxis marina]|uniref:ATP phosphoribosyltransferase regulatory subunit n=1 Tax=Parasphingopyxis marina TaxID=2761622 RepID=A0A842I1Y3_9SPHN|nr:ATP phosphoribosyltransferase regulatory subunit [Parasphingopyxis marina]MBC2778699.1 ATP phosphoribosyltransferase regulatory subunit [Parasphingopyxis marina]
MTSDPISKGLLPEGLRDRLPPDAEAAARLLRTVLDTVASYGYERVSPPLAEFEEGLVGQLKLGGAQDLLRIIDPASQRTLALRPDITAQVGRIASTRMAHRARPLRLAYGGEVLKLRATQLRPERQLLQAGAELIGSDGVAAAREILTMAVEALTAAGVGEITVDLTLPDLVPTLAAGPFPLPEGQIESVRAELDEKDAGAIAALGAEAYLPLIRAAGPIGPALERMRAIDAGDALTSRLDGLQQIAEALEGRATVTLDPTERHGFEYQSWIGFSLFGAELGGEIGRGGSYAICAEGDAEEPAMGFSLYLDPLVDAGLGAKDKRRLFVPLGTDPALAVSLRAEGWRTVAALTDADSAERLGCTHRLDGQTPQPL